MSTLYSDWILTFLLYAAGAFILVVGSVALLLVILLVLDVSQTADAVRRNYPVIGRLRRVSEHLGIFVRRYFLTQDREELPFNRAQRMWVERASEDLDNTVPYGSTRDLRPVGTVMFTNAAFPELADAVADRTPMVVGPHCREPYDAPSLFNISGMSYGSLSNPAIRAMSRGAAKAGCWLNTGEGGLAPCHLEGGCDLVFQIGTAKYGVRAPDGSLSDERLRDVANHPQVRMFEVKLSQGAKPGKGGILPGGKVTEEVAAIRGIPVGQDSISPNRFPEIDSVDDLLDFIGRIREVTGKPVGFKTVIGDPEWIEELLQAIGRRGERDAPDFITVDSADGGSGAAPLPLIDYVGLPIAESLPLVVDRLTAHRLRERIRVVASGKLIMPGPVAWALATGADFVQSARGFMFAVGCIQAMQCNRNTCPTGVTTHNPRLQRGLVAADKAERVADYVKNLCDEVGIIAHSCGVLDPRQLRRHHCRIVQADGRSMPMSELYPEVAPAARSEEAAQP